MTDTNKSMYQIESMNLWQHVKIQMTLCFCEKCAKNNCTNLNELIDCKADLVMMTFLFHNTIDCSYFLNVLCDLRDFWPKLFLRNDFKPQTKMYSLISHDLHPNNVNKACHDLWLTLTGTEFDMNLMAKFYYLRNCARNLLFSN